MTQMFEDDPSQLVFAEVLAKAQRPTWRQSWLLSEYAPCAYIDVGGQEYEIYRAEITSKRRKLLSTWIMEDEQPIESYYFIDYQDFGEQGIIWAPYIPLYSMKYVDPEREEAEESPVFDFYWEMKIRDVYLDIVREDSQMILQLDGDAYEQSFSENVGNITIDIQEITDKIVKDIEKEYLEALPGIMRRNAKK